jgi:hypothetical protein
MDEPDDDFEGPCELEQYIQERAKRSPDFPRIVEEARRNRGLARLADMEAGELLMDPEDFEALQARLGDLPRDNPRLKALLATEKPVPSEMELSDDFLALHRASEAGDDDVSEEFDFELLETHPVDEEDQSSS